MFDCYWTHDAAENHPRFKRELVVEDPSHPIEGSRGFKGSKYEPIVNFICEKTLYSEHLSNGLCKFISMNICRASFELIEPLCVKAGISRGEWSSFCYMFKSYSLRGFHLVTWT